MENHVDLENQTRKLGEGDTLPPRHISLELPQGLFTSLAVSPEAADFFSGLDAAAQGQIVSYIQGSNTGEEAKARTKTVMDSLKTGSLGFLQG